MKQKYYLRGLGFGILITTLVFIVTGPNQPSDEEIIKRAEELGYVKEEQAASSIGIKELLETGTPAPTPTSMPQNTPEPTFTPTPEPTAEPTFTPTPEPTATATSTPTPVPTTTVTPKPTTLPEEVVTAVIVIERGNTATVVCNKMEEAGILEDGNEFRRYLVKLDLTDYINIGTYTLSSDMSFEEIAGLLTGR